MRELWNVRKAHVARLRVQQQQDVSLAWTTEALARTKTMPTLASLLSDGKRQTPDQQVHALQSLSDIYGIPLVITEPAVGDTVVSQER